MDIFILEDGANLLLEDGTSLRLESYIDPITGLTVVGIAHVSDIGISPTIGIESIPALAAVASSGITLTIGVNTLNALTEIHHPGFSVETLPSSILAQAGIPLFGFEVATFPGSVFTQAEIPALGLEIGAPLSSVLAQAGISTPGILAVSASILRNVSFSIDGESAARIVLERVVTTISVTEEQKLQIEYGTSQGQRGPSLISGIGSPSLSDGINGDYYLDEFSEILYGPKQGQWPVVGLFFGIIDRHVHVQASPSSTWSISHNLGGRPLVMVFDESDDLICVEISHPSPGEVLIESETPFSGTAHLA